MQLRRPKLKALRAAQTQQAAAAGTLPADVAAAFTALANSQKELMDSLKHQDERRMSLVDTKFPQRRTKKELVDAFDGARGALLGFFTTKSTNWIFQP